jgi:hypothetical protein
VPTFGSVVQLLGAEAPDFVIASVPWAVMPDATQWCIATRSRGARLSEDDIGVATLLERTGAWARDEGPEPYPLAEGLQDHLISVAIEESLATGRDVTTTTEAWAAAAGR